MLSRFWPLTANIMIDECICLRVLKSKARMDFAIIDILFVAPYQGDQLGLGYTHTSTPSKFEFNFSVFDMWRNPYFGN